MPDFSVPRWLQPLSQGEERQIRLLENQAQQKAGVMLRRYIGMRRADSEAKQAVANGVDPLTARQNALLNNASLIFSDNPQAVSNMLNHEEVNQIRERAQLQMDQYREGLLTNRELALKQQQERDAQLAEHRQSLLDARNREIDLRGQIAEQKAAKQDITPEIRVLTNPESGEKLSVVRTGPNTWQTTERKPGQVGDLDKLKISSLYSEKRDVNRDLAKLGSPTPKDTEETINARTALVNRKSQIQKQIDKLSGTRIGTPKTSEQPAPVPTPTADQLKAPANLRLGTIVQQGGKKYRYIGGDTNDPNSYAEVTE